MSDTTVDTPEPTLAEQAQAASDADAENRRLLTLPIGSVRPADGIEARVDRLESLFRSNLHVAVPTPEDALAASIVQDQATADAVQAAVAADAAAQEPAPVAPAEDTPPAAPTEPLDTTLPDAGAPVDPPVAETTPPDPSVASSDESSTTSDSTDSSTTTTDVPADPSSPADAVATAQTLPDQDALNHIEAALVKWPDDPDLLAAQADLKTELGQ